MGINDLQNQNKWHKSCPDVNINKSKTNTYDKYIVKCRTIPNEAEDNRYGHFVNHLKSQKEYISNHLKIKAGIYETKTKTNKFPTKKSTIRDYTPKIINQDVTMGMWI